MRLGRREKQIGCLTDKAGEHVDVGESQLSKNKMISFGAGSYLFQRVGHTIVCAMMDGFDGLEKDIIFCGNKEEKTKSKSFIVIFYGTRTFHYLDIGTLDGESEGTISIYANESMNE